MSTALRSALAEPRAVPAPPVRVWRDWVLVAVLVPTATLEGLLQSDLAWRPLVTAMAVCLVPLLLWRRTHPLAVVVVAFGAVTALDIAFIVTDTPPAALGSMVFFLLLPYALFRWGSGVEAAIGLAVILPAATVGILISWTGPGDALGGSAVLLSSMALGVAVRSATNARQRQLDQVKSAERVQLARELHDTVAHHVSAIAIQAQAGRALAASSPHLSLKTLEVIEAEATRTLTEMRAMVRVLRNAEEAEFSPQPGVADIERLAASAGDAPHVRVEVSGEVSGLPAAVDVALYRMAQEAITNALRHARHATVVDVSVTGAPSTVSLRVLDDGDPPDGRALGPTGFGLVGMTERATLLGGTCEAGPCPGGGWAVHAVLPREIPG